MEDKDILNTIGNFLFLNCVVDSRVVHFLSCFMVYISITNYSVFRIVPSDAFVLQKWLKTKISVQQKTHKVNK